VRAVIADDNLLARRGIAGLLQDAGVEVVAQAASVAELLDAVDVHEPDIAIVDIRMPPDYHDEGVRAAQQIRARHPGVGIVLISQHVDLGTAMRVLAERPERLGYLLKDRVIDPDDFAASARRVADGGTALDPTVVSRLLAATRERSPLATLTARERDVLQLVAEGRSNKGIATRLEISERAVQKHVTAIFGRLGLPSGEDDNRRILAVLAYLRANGAERAHR
jgi:DNA-binding NarL/FixJ family response regulator